MTFKGKNPPKNSDSTRVVRPPEDKFGKPLEFEGLPGNKIRAIQDRGDAGSRTIIFSILDPNELKSAGDQTIQVFREEVLALPNGGFGKKGRILDEMKKEHLEPPDETWLKLEYFNFLSSDAGSLVLAEKLKEIFRERGKDPENEIVTVTDADKAQAMECAWRDERQRRSDASEKAWLDINKKLNLPKKEEPQFADARVILPEEVEQMKLEMGIGKKIPMNYCQEMRVPSNRLEKERNFNFLNSKAGIITTIAVATAIAIVGSWFLVNLLYNKEIPTKQEQAEPRKPQEELLQLKSKSVEIPKAVPTQK